MGGEGMMLRCVRNRWKVGGRVKMELEKLDGFGVGLQGRRREGDRDVTSQQKEDVVSRLN
jgi:hypothetical protein